jgi:spore maturation protein CgeB
MRLFELAAMGCCIVTNPIAGLHEWFDPGREVLVAPDSGELVQCYRHLLTHPQERQAMGNAARRRLLEEHTYRHRAQNLVTTLGFR